MRLLLCLFALLAMGVRDAAFAQVTLSPGDIVVAEEFGVAPDLPGIIRVDPLTGAQEVFASGPPFVNPLGLAFETSGDLIVTDGFDGNSILRVDRDLATIAVLSSGLPYLIDPSGVGIAVAGNGDIYVADFTNGVVRVDPVTGAQTLVSTGGLFVFPTGLTFEADGNLIVVDRDAEGGNGAVIRVDPLTGAQSLVSSGGNFTDPVWVALEADGGIVLTERLTFGGAVIRVNPVTGAQTVVSQGGHFSLATSGIAVDGDGDILVADFNANAVIRVDPVSGAQTIVSQGGFFNAPVGVAVVLCHADEQCDDDNPCTVDRCARGTSGANAFGCTNAAAPAGTECRAAAGSCDASETCDGTVCPPDVKRTDVCRPTGGACDVPESCDGVSNHCPADRYVAAAVSCRSAAGVCDAPESCTGTSPACPPDVKRSTVCRPATGACDQAESCDGSGDHCPTDRYLSGETACRASLGVCDPAEYCSGYAPNCPYDARSTAVCRAGNGSCDPEERCDGVGAACPPNLYAPAGAACTSDGNDCTRDRCNGSGGCTHPNELDNTVCSDDGASCTDDVCFAEVGQVSRCVHRPNDVRCDVDRDSCTADVCDPARSTLVSGCRLSAFKAAGTGCDDRNPCTQGDKCMLTEGSATACGAGAKLATGSIDCDGNVCTVGDYCSSTTKACVSGTRLLPAGSVCNDGNACSAADQCTSTGACAGTPIPDGQACDDRNGCTSMDQCVIGVCGGITLPDTAPCDDGNRCTLDSLDRCQRGSCTGGPKTDCSLSTLFSPRCQPSTGLCCGKISKKGSTVVCQ